jgi:hypothetical protein
MHIHLISLIRNERDILPSFLSHVGALFDSAQLIDHMSTDGTADLLERFCAELPGWTFGRLRCLEYLQSEVATALTRRAFAIGADAVIFLDADEFIHGLTRDALGAAISILEDRQMMGSFYWRNCAPETFDEDFLINAPSFIGDISPHKKIFLPKWIYERYGDSFVVNQGAHSIAMKAGSYPDIANVGEILHFPLRSERQFVMKIVSTYLAQLQRGVVSPNTQYLIRVIAEGQVDASTIAALAMRYGEFSDKADMAVMDPLSGVKSRIPDVALVDGLDLAVLRRVLDHAPNRLDVEWEAERLLEIGDEVIAL